MCPASCGIVGGYVEASSRLAMKRRRRPANHAGAWGCQQILRMNFAQTWRRYAAALAVLSEDPSNRSSAILHGGRGAQATCPRWSSRAGHPRREGLRSSAAASDSAEHGGGIRRRATVSGASPLVDDIQACDLVMRTGSPGWRRLGTPRRQRRLASTGRSRSVAAPASKITVNAASASSCGPGSTAPSATPAAAISGVVPFRRQACVGDAFEQYAHQRDIGRFDASRTASDEAISMVRLPSRAFLLSCVDFGALRTSLRKSVRPSHHVATGRAG